MQNVTYPVLGDIKRTSRAIGQAATADEALSLYRSTQRDPSGPMPTFHLREARDLRLNDDASYAGLRGGAFEPVWRP